MTPKPSSSSATFFSTPTDWRVWLGHHHANARELWVGFYKRGSGRPSITWPESVDGALCYGWIDGVRKSIDAASYMVRFTPRTSGSTWSVVNIRRAQELSKLGLMRAAGRAVFEKRGRDRLALDSYERRKLATLPLAYEKEFRKDAKSWKFFQRQPPWYRRTSAYWVTSAKKEETRLRRLALLIECSKRETAIPALLRPTRREQAGR